MTKLLALISVIGFRLMVCVHSEFIEPSPSLALRSFSGTQTRMPCRFTVEGDEKLVQVTWYREKPGGEREQIIIGHFTEGPKGVCVCVCTIYKHKLCFICVSPSLVLPISSLEPVILQEGQSFRVAASCRSVGHPSPRLSWDTDIPGQSQNRTGEDGVVTSHGAWTVWFLPISSLEPVILQEGQSFRVAASCRSVGHPSPRLSWDTDIPGQSQNRTGEDGVVTSQFSVHPLRSMNKRRLDCLVWHPALDGPHRISNELVVHFPPDALIADSGSWRIGHSGSELRCVVKGNPLPQNVTWSRKDSRLPAGVLVKEDTLVFVRPLNVTDEGVYVCQTANSAGIAKAEFKVEIGKHASESAHALGSLSETLLIVIVAGVLVIVIVIAIVFVNCHLRRKNRKLKRALSVRTEEMISLSRQVSMRRLNSINTDPRTAPEESSLIQMDSVTKGSVLSVEDHSTLSDVRGRRGDREYDSLGRPAIYTTYRPERSSKNTREIEEERNERRRRVESYVKSSNMSLDSGLHRDQSSPPPSVSSGLTADAIGEGWKRGSRREIHRDVQRERVPEGEEESSAVSSYQLSEAVSNYFQCSNGGLTPKANPNAIIIHSHGPVI
ncbi:nectin-4 [Sinocyclocheilus rhinocerous]|uniref:nectin-4 n=1 Tax=Sinocyclocheilus rhinocerous TaxID=307959 RepID=UPI0007B7E56E|nr:PREDICTED: nectin-4-like [Sinocyclocheilus rhinocerous]